MFCTATLEPPQFGDFLKVTLILQYRIFFNFAESFILPLLSFFSDKKGGSPSSLLRYKQLNPRYRVFLLSFPIAKVSYYVTIMTTSCFEIIGVSYHTIRLLLRYTVL